MKKIKVWRDTDAYGNDDSYLEHLSNLWNTNTFPIDHPDIQQDVVLMLDGVYFSVLGKEYRYDGSFPSYYRINGHMEFRKNDKLHRFDGPAVIMDDSVYWFVNGNEVTELEMMILSV